ncbi:hypothetical protein TEPIDINF_002146 [Tepidibacillus infernus]|uniref:hypothetical protein n=1 Tax=Tepidibacillus infernus TaxID=1806172 RepID=UPI003B6B4B27
MSKCSKWMIGHDKSISLDINRPSPNEIENEIKDFEEYVRLLRRRGEQKRDEREAMLRPQTVDIG